ncbi:MAG TPA: BatD family protein, partial [Pontiella sp.]
MNIWKILLFAILLSPSITHGSTNQYAQATTSQTKVFLGQVFHLDVTIKSDKKPRPPILSGLLDFNSTVLVEGRPTSVNNTWHYRFALRPTREGTLTIPPLDFGSVSSNPVIIEAEKPEESARMTLTQELSAQSVFAGEPVVLTTTWDTTYQLVSIKAVDFNFPILNDKRFQVLELYDPDKESRKQTTGIPVQGTRILADRKSYQKGEVQHQTLSFKKILIPEKSGSIELEKATLLCAAERKDDVPNSKWKRTTFQYPAYFDNTFFDHNADGENWKRIYAEAPALKLEVKPLPRENRPDTFNGMVGNFSLSVNAEPTNLRIGDPITLTITVSSDTFMENILFPPLRHQPLLINQFEIPSDRALPQRKEKSKIYTQTIRPLSAELKEIPPIQLSFFNPASNAYVTVQSKPIPIQVTPPEDISVFG